MTPKQHAIALLKFTRSIGTNMLKDLPEDKYLHQNSPTDNHVLWTLGHLATTDAWMAGVVGASGATVPESWQGVFGMGSKPQTDPSKYPSITVVKQAWDANRAAMLNWLEGATDKDLAQQLKEKTGGFANDPIDGALKLAWHEGWHCGQIATLRKALGVPLMM